MHGTEASRAVWVAAGVGTSALAVLLLSFFPWFHLTAAREGAELESVLEVEVTGWDTLLGALAVLAALLGGVLVAVPWSLARGYYLVPAVVAAVLALARLLVAPTKDVLGESLSYSRTGWVALAAVAALVEAVVAVAGTSHRNQAQVG